MQTTLYYREGSSDKVYQAAMEPQGNGFVVNFAYGRRGTTLQTGTKTQTPVDQETATKVFTKLINEKKAKGYTPGENGTPYQHTDKQSNGILPQLLNPIAEAEVQRLLKDKDHVAQEKYDGRRILVQKQGAAIHGINRKGLFVGLPSPIVVSVTQIPGDFVLDGECVGEKFHTFDLLHLDGADHQQQPYQQRLTNLMNLLASAQQRHVYFADTAFTAAQKVILFKRLKAANKEGIVFKRLDAPYTAGRPNSGGSQLKHKFVATLSAVVAKVNDKRSVEVRLLNGNGWNPCGNVTIPVNFSIPEIGTVVEVRYLYAFRESNALFQPVYLGPRHDVEQHECVLSQLKFKNDEE